MRRLTVVGLIVCVVGFIVVFNIEFKQGDQPIQFPHSVHAGDRQIQCAFCHTGVLKGDVAGVPSVSDCYQCHQVVQKASSGAAGTAEIQKVVDAYKTGKPIEWFKVYNLPRHVHFSHRQHVSVGKIDCSACHGDLTKQRTAQYMHDIGMGFCINCHRQHLKENSSLMDCSTCHY